VAGCLTAANKGEILQAEAVRDRLTDPAARRYAEAMVEMHTDALTTDKEAFAAAGIQALPSLGAAVLTADSALITKALVKAPEAKVDLVYAESQVVVHGRVLFAVENELAPKARGEVTQARLRAARDMVKAHLEEAKALYETLKGNNAP
jgi:predicted outer membrane protein